MAFSFERRGALETVSQLVYGRIAVAIRPYGKWNTAVRHMRYGEETWAMGLPSGLTTTGKLHGEGKCGSARVFRFEGLEPVVDEFAGERQFLGNGGQMLAVKPCPLAELAFL